VAARRADRWRRALSGFDAIACTDPGAPPRRRRHHQEAQRRDREPRCSIPTPGLLVKQAMQTSAIRGGIRGLIKKDIADLEGVAAEAEFR